MPPLTNLQLLEGGSHVVHVLAAAVAAAAVAADVRIVAFMSEANWIRKYRASMLDKFQIDASSANVGSCFSHNSFEIA